MAEAYGAIAKFRTQEALIAATKEIRARGYTVIDTFTPYPVNALKEPLGFHEWSVPRLTLLGGATGFLVALFMQGFTNWDYPINVGGRAIYPISAFAVVAFELTILGTVLFALFGMLALNRLPRLHHPIFAAREFERASDDRFFLFVSARDPKYAKDRTLPLLRDSGAISVEVVNET
ncbi:MAG TPA: DUF3341 domain-containing protein [Xanthobacteraceae bacterium]|nr:DUF3341 domain-containing protein [Xanthobacteraceae bacterium]